MSRIFLHKNDMHIFLQQAAAAGSQPACLPGRGGRVKKKRGQESACLNKRDVGATKRGRARRSFHRTKYLKRKEKERKYIKWQYD
jgi:hypothetical protein